MAMLAATRRPTATCAKVTGRTRIAASALPDRRWGSGCCTGWRGPGRGAQPTPKRCADDREDDRSSDHQYEAEGHLAPSLGLLIRCPRSATGKPIGRSTLGPMRKIFGPPLRAGAICAFVTGVVL